MKQNRDLRSPSVALAAAVFAALLAGAGAPADAPATEAPPASPPPPPTLLGPGEMGAVIEALGQMHLTPSDLVWDRDYVNRPDATLDPWRLPLAEQMLRDPLHVPGHSQALARAALQAGTGLDAQWRAAAGALSLMDPPEGFLPRSDVPLSSDIEIPPAPVPPGKAGRTLLRQWHHLAPVLRAELIEDVRALHALRREARTALGGLGASPEEWSRFREQALRAIDPRTREDEGEAEERERVLALLAGVDGVDRGGLMAVAVGLAALAGRIESVAAALPPGSWPTEPLELDTPAGRFIIGTPRADLHSGDAALVLDPGGDDRYLLGGARHPGEVQLLLDLGGNDSWRSPFPGSLGGAFGGAAVLVDAAGDDVYDGGKVSVGAGLLGYGAVIDRGGSDTYLGDALTQGAALFGGGVLVDAGDAGDNYRAGVYGQGFGMTLGYGALVDLGGNDTYSAGGTYGDSPSRYPDHTLSLSQGFGIGFRPYAGGGIGLLADASGNDSYSADLFAQGCSYWFSAGVLYDVGGSDHYRAWQYGQGSGIHLSAALLADLAGDDQYTIGHLGQGSSHDLAVGWLIDRAGNDLYQGASTVQGGSLTNAVSFFVDVAGNDAYSARTLATSRGGGEVRRHMGSVGVFLDLQGDDVYTEADEAGQRRPPPTAAGARPWVYGIAIDRQGPPEGASAMYLSLPQAAASPAGPRQELPAPGPVPAAAAEVMAANDWLAGAERSSQQIADLAARGPDYLPDLLALLPREYLLEQYTVGRIVQAILERTDDAGRESAWQTLRAHLQGAPEYDGLRWPMSWIAVAGLHTDDTVAALTSRAHSPRWRLRLAVAESLGVLASPRAAPSLLMLMGDEKESVRAVAAWALGRSGGDGALPALAEALRDRSFLVRFNAAAALVERAAAGEGKAVVAHARAFRKQAAEPAALGLADDLMVAVEDPTDEALRRFWGLGPQAAPPPSPPAVRAAPAPERKSRKDRGR